MPSTCDVGSRPSAATLAVVVLRWFEQRAERDVADVLGCSVGTAHTEGVEALGRLRDALPRADLGAGGLR